METVSFFQKDVVMATCKKCGEKINFFNSRVTLENGEKACEQCYKKWIKGSGLFTEITNSKAPEKQEKELHLIDR